MRICSKFVQLHDSKCPVEREPQLQNSLKIWKTLTLKCFEFDAYFTKVALSKNGTQRRSSLPPNPQLGGGGVGGQANFGGPS